MALGSVFTGLGALLFSLGTFLYVRTRKFHGMTVQYEADGTDRTRVVTGVRVWFLPRLFWGLGGLLFVPGVIVLLRALAE